MKAQDLIDELCKLRDDGFEEIGFIWLAQKWEKSKKISLLTDRTFPEGAKLSILYFE